METSAAAPTSSAAPTTAPADEPLDPGPTLVDRILSPLRLAGGFVFLAGSSAVLIPVALALLPWRTARIKFCNYYGKVAGRALMAFGGITPVIRNKERIGAAYPAIYVSNHTSVNDMFFATYLCPVGGCGVAKKEVGNIPFFGWLYRLSGHLLIDRGDRQSAIAGLKATAELPPENPAHRVDAPLTLKAAS